MKQINKKSILQGIGIAVIIASIYFFVVILPLLIGMNAEPTTDTVTQYAKQGIVTEIDTQQDVVTFIDTQGRAWSFYGVEDWQEGDMLACIMDTQGTDTVYDDAVLCATYQGHAE